MKTQEWILVGGDTLLGKEVRDLLAERELPVHLRLCSSGSDERVLTEDEGELSVMEPLSADLLKSASVVLLAGTPAASKAAVAMAAGMKQSPAFIDLTGELEGLAESRLRAPVLEPGGEEYPAGTIHSIAHPAAAALARLLILIHRHHPVHQAVVTVIEPASARGQSGIEELHKQSISLFSFHTLPKDVYDTQVSFNLLPRYGDEAKLPLSGSETRIEKHIASLLGPHGVPLPSLRLIHAPVFHGYCQSIWLEFESRPAVQLIEKLLEEAGVDVRKPEHEPASNAGVAGQSGITVSDVAHDRGNPRSLWIWAASDNLRGIAENAILAAGMLARKGVR